MTKPILDDPPGEDPDDPGAHWMLAYQRGDEQAFDQIVAAYSGQVYALISRFLGQRAAREDLVQEVFLRVVRARERYEPTALFSTWMYRITYNICVNETQRARPSALRLVDDAGSEDGAVESSIEDPRQLGPLAALERGDVVRAVREAIEALPEKQRMALVLAKFHELPYAQIAEVLESSENAIKSLVHRARENLRARLQPFLQEGPA